MTLEHIALLIGLLPALYIVGNKCARTLWHNGLACWFTQPLPYHQPDHISRARFRSALVGKRGASLPPRASRLRRGMTRVRPLVFSQLRLISLIIKRTKLLIATLFVSLRKLKSSNYDLFQ
jgi:hypothetical protein